MLLGYLCIQGARSCTSELKKKKLGWSDHNLGTHEPAKILSNVQFTFINTRYLVRLYMIREYIPGFREDPNAISMLKVEHQEV